MVLFKIYGERNSGTTFLTNILKLNGFPVYVHKNKGEIVYHWKHGVPNNECKQMDNIVIDIFIFRPLNSWLISMFNNPYELIDTWGNDFSLFLNNKQLSNNYWKDSNNEAINKDDNEKNIFEIRYYKFNKIMEYNERCTDVILLNLSFIQNEKNLSQFLDFISDKYMPKLKVSNYKLNIKHTKNGSKQKNRIYETNINEFKDIISLNKNIEIEDFINKLTFVLNTSVTPYILNLFN